ncbi:3-dehydroshikimate dehydratase [Phlyctema vagabunda]|uniref:3-dehydroshikimate dehydratase n=1 Tax=Phlyctema vagabunda TaxID=108571 RepID=A0ABR4PIB4_9HELO
MENRFGVATLSLGSWKQHKLETRLEEAAKAGFKWIDLFDDDWAAYLSENEQDPERPWDATEGNLAVARKLGQFVKSRGMRIICTQPCREIEGIKDPNDRKRALDRVKSRFPFMRAFDTNLVFMCANTRTDAGVTSDFKTIARDLAELGDAAAAYAQADGGPMIKIGYEGLSWATRNTWSSTWEVVRAANRGNVGLIVDSFHILAIEFADPYNPAGHGLMYPTLQESLQLLRSSLTSLTRTVPGDKIFFLQVADAELVDASTFSRPQDPNTPDLLPWARRYRLYPEEQSRGGYMPVDLVVAAVLQTGYSGPISLEVFNDSLSSSDPSVPESHAARGFSGLQRLITAVQKVPRF